MEKRLIIIDVRVHKACSLLYGSWKTRTMGATSGKVILLCIIVRLLLHLQKGNNELMKLLQKNPSLKYKIIVELG